MELELGTEVTNVKDNVAARTAKQVRFGACHAAERRRDTPLSIYRLF